ncbi:4288_t:CDS:2 [Dentiscutata erythropus]|uniref:4288_t:CDS:1 n=1 Tax=Dentiscutata erythropus TaxID=1348616 RepID=A0A9N9BJ10_9GLOM|nr:4288_t:CDS:2 [Dentiscutata erythropus]
MQQCLSKLFDKKEQEDHIYSVLSYIAPEQFQRKSYIQTTEDGLCQ